MSSVPITDEILEMEIYDGSGGANVNLETGSFGGSGGGGGGGVSPPSPLSPLHDINNIKIGKINNFFITTPVILLLIKKTLSGNKSPWIKPFGKSCGQNFTKKLKLRKVI